MQTKSLSSMFRLTTIFFVIAFAAGMAQGASPAKPPVKEVQARLDSLIKAAKSEGELTFYSGATENVAKRASDAFAAKYGIRTQFTRIAGVGLLQRYGAEADAGNFAADAILIAGGALAFANDAIKKGWIESISEAGIPVILSGEFPAEFNKGLTAVVQTSPWLLAYHSERVKGGDIPKDWPDILNPRFKGQLILPDPRASDAYLDLWAALLDKYGEPFFSRLRAQGPRFVSQGVQAMQGLGAGEGDISLPQITSGVMAIKDKGAPVGAVTPPYTTGVEMQIILTARQKAKHPNAARLFANYVLSSEGNKVVNDEPEGITLYDTSKLPKEYQSPKPGTAGRKDQIVKLLGL